MKCEDCGCIVDSDMCINCDEEKWNATYPDGKFPEDENYYVCNKE